MQQWNLDNSFIVIFCSKITLYIKLQQVNFEPNTCKLGGIWEIMLIFLGNTSDSHLEVRGASHFFLFP